MSESGSFPELRLRRVWGGQGSPMMRGLLSVAAGALPNDGKVIADERSLS